MVSKGQAVIYEKVAILPKKIDGDRLSRQLYLNRAPADQRLETFNR